MTKSQFPHVPSMNEAHPPYAELTARRYNLLNRQSELERELQRLRRGTVPKSAIAAASVGTRERAAELVGDLVPSAESAPVEVRVDIEAIRVELQRELDAVNAAIKLVDAELIRSARTASDAVVDAVRKPYNAALHDLAVAVSAAISAHDQITYITRELTADGTPWLGQLLQPTSVRSAFAEFNDHQTPARKLVQDILAAGHVKAGELSHV